MDGVQQTYFEAEGISTRNVEWLPLAALRFATTARLAKHATQEHDNILYYSHHCTRVITLSYLPISTLWRPNGPNLHVTMRASQQSNGLDIEGCGGAYRHSYR